MKKLILSLSILVLISSCTIRQPANNTVNVSPKNETTSKPADSYEQAIQNTSSKIKDTPEFQDCMKKQSNMCIQSTGMQIAQRVKDTTFCKELATPEQKTCEFAVTMINAQEKNDEKICDNLSEKSHIIQCKTQIYRQHAITKQDIMLCEKIDEIIVWTGASDISERDNQKDKCIMQYVMNNKGSKKTDCNNIRDTASYEMCQKIIKTRK